MNEYMWITIVSVLIQWQEEVLEFFKLFVLTIFIQWMNIQV
jgi:hypothetical protein